MADSLLSSAPVNFGVDLGRFPKVHVLSLGRHSHMKPMGWKNKYMSIYIYTHPQGKKTFNEAQLLATMEGIHRFTRIGSYHAACIWKTPSIWVCHHHILRSGGQTFVLVFGAAGTNIPQGSLEDLFG